MHLTLPKHPGMIAIAVLVIVMLVWGFWPRPVLVEIVTAQRAPPGQDLGLSERPARIFSTIGRQRSSGHVQASGWSGRLFPAGLFMLSSRVA